VALRSTLLRLTRWSVRCGRRRESRAPGHQGNCNVLHDEPLDALRPCSSISPNYPGPGKPSADACEQGGQHVGAIHPGSPPKTHWLNGLAPMPASAPPGCLAQPPGKHRVERSQSYPQSEPDSRNRRSPEAPSRHGEQQSSDPDKARSQSPADGSFDPKQGKGKTPRYLKTV